MQETKVTPFSQELDAWLHSKHPKTIAGLVQAAGEKSFALIFVVLMCIPALPLPTGGVTHIFEAIVLLLALELVIGRRTIWLPKKWLHKPLGKTLQSRTLPYLIRKVRWLEKYSRPRFGHIMTNREFLRLTGLLVMAGTLGAFLAPPFSGLDTLPALGVVTLSLGIILEDTLVYVAGIVIGAFGIFLEIGLGTLIVEAAQKLF